MEATIAILIVSSVLVVVYSRQVEREDPQDYIFVLQKHVLADISSRSDLRKLVLEAAEGGLDGKPMVPPELDAFADGKIPDAYAFHIRICNLGDLSDACKMNETVFRKTIDKNVYVEETVVSTELTSKAYSPKKVRLFLWEDV